MKNWDVQDEVEAGKCSMDQDLQDMRQVCDKLRIPSLQVG